MQSKLLKFCIVIMFCIVQTGLYAQETFSASGGNAAGTGGSVSYSVGQLFFMTHTGADGSVAGGVQHPYEISVLTSIMETEGIDLNVSAFPNPVTDHLILRIDLNNYENLRFMLFDISGRIVQNGKVVNRETIIEMADLTRTTYILKVLEKEKEIKTFRIIKH